MMLAAARSGCPDALKSSLQKQGAQQLAAVKEAGTGATPLHLAAAGGYDECVEALLEAEADCLVCDAAGSLPLHSAAQGSIPMCAYQLASRAPAACLERDGSGRTPIQLAAAGDRGEVLNAMLLACAAHASPEALAAMRGLLEAGAVCDTWAPNGSSALMLAASADCAEGVGLLLDHAASLELQDALGRTALMFAAGNSARGALEALLDRGASVSIRDRRGRNVLDYAAAGSEVRTVLQERISEMERRAARLQEELLAELMYDEAPAQQQQQQQQQQKERGSKKGGKKKKGKQQGKAKPAAAAAAEAAEPEPESDVSEPPAAAVASEQQPGVQQAAAATAVAQEEPQACAEEQEHEEGPAGGSNDAPSSDWQVVGSRPHRQHGGGAPQRQQSHPRPVEGGGRIRRCPSASSLSSNSSGESHDTHGSSQRSVLIMPSRSSSAARGHLPASAKPMPAVLVAVPSPAEPAWGKTAAAGGNGAALPALAPTAEQPPVLQPNVAPIEGVPAGLPLAEAWQDAAALAAEVASLRAQLAALQLEKQLVEEQHQKELAAVLEETAAHEAAAVAEAVSAERMHCVVKLASFLQLQNNGLAADLLGRHGLAAVEGGAFSAGLGGAGTHAAAAVAFPGDAGFGFLGFLPPMQTASGAASAAAAVKMAGTLAGSLLGGSGSPSLSPLSCSPPFCYSALEQRLRTEFSGDVSHFVQPAAAEPDALASLPEALI